MAIEVNRKLGSEGVLIKSFIGVIEDCGCGVANAKSILISAGVPPLVVDRLVNGEVARRRQLVAA